MSAEIFKQLVGKWEGTCKTWFEPGKLADESSVSGEFIALLDGAFLRHVYTGSMQGQPRQGEDLLAFNGVREVFQSAWFDSFHMNSALLISEGPAREKGFHVLGYYDIPNYPQWGWRTEFELESHDSLIIRAYNIMPERSSESLAMETRYSRPD